MTGVQRVLFRSVIEAESETGLKIIESLQEDETADSSAAVKDEDVEVDPTTYEAKTPETEPAAPHTEEGFEEDKFYTK